MTDDGPMNEMQAMRIAKDRVDKLQEVMGGHHDAGGHMGSRCKPL